MEQIDEWLKNYYYGQLSYEHDLLLILDNNTKINYLFDKIYSNFENPHNVNLLAIMYENGIGVPKNIPKSIELYKQAIKLNNPNAMNNLAYIYSNNDVLKNIPKAIELHEEGKIVTKNISKAIELYKKAVKLNNSKAMNNLAYIYKNDKYDKYDIQKAIKLYEKAVKLNNPYAMRNLAFIYLYNSNYNINKRDGIKLLLKAIDLELTDANNNLIDAIKQDKSLANLLLLEYNDLLKNKEKRILELENEIDNIKYYLPPNGPGYLLALNNFNSMVK
jgi:TPR repeat protein